MKISSAAIFFAATMIGGTHLANATDITIFDGRVSGGQAASSWHNQGNAPGEDHEVEPGCVGSQVWDMEGFVLEGTVLTMVSGYNIGAGQSDGSQTWKPGDLFFDVDGVPSYGTDVNGTTGNNRTAIPNVFGYDYALRLDVGAQTYQLWELDADAILYDSFFQLNQASDPWTYKQGGTVVAPAALPFTFTYSTYNDQVNDQGYGYLGGNHYVASIDLAAFLDASADQDFYVHYTMECGNDNLMGHGSWTRPDVPNQPMPDTASAMLLLSMGLAGLGALSRRLR